MPYGHSHIPDFAVWQVFMLEISPIMALLLQEDTPTCVTPRKRDVKVPSQASIDALRAPELEKMCVEFQEANQVLLCEKGGEQKVPARETKIPIFADSSLLRDGRLPLTAMN